MTGKLLTPEIVADRLGISVASVYKLIESGKLLARNVGTGTQRPRWRIEESDLAAFGREHRAS
jgi:excisionase family DNA binding protein